MIVDGANVPAIPLPEIMALAVVAVVVARP
jgi:hypothetical protein